MNILIPFLK